MDIFEYIDRVKANFDKQPEPRYNTKKYFTDNVDDIGPGLNNRGKIPRLNVMPDVKIKERGTGIMVDPRGFQDGKIPVLTQELNEGGVATPKRGLVDGPGSYRGDPAYKKKWYEENKERLLKERREKYKALSPEEKTRKAQKSIEFQKTEEGKKIRAERHKIRKLAKDPLSPGDKKMLNRFKLNLKYSKVVNDIIANHNGMRPNPETLSELVQVHYEVDPEFQKDLETSIWRCSFF